ncbi:MAG: rubredoxin [Bacteroidales bacterium]
MYKCKICGYVYNPEIGDPTQNIEPGTKFEDILPTWKCPVCSVSKDEFETL